MITVTLNKNPVAAIYRTPHIGTCRCGATKRADFKPDADTATCSCGRRVQFKPINATQDDSVRCSDKCVSAKRPSCNCECGGKNHGSQW